MASITQSLKTVRRVVKSRINDSLNVLISPICLHRAPQYKNDTKYFDNVSEKIWRLTRKQKENEMMSSRVLLDGFESQKR